MSSKVELNSNGVRELLQSKEMMDICSELANEARAKCGRGYEVTTHKGRTRVNAEIAAVTRRAKKDNAKNNTILRALK